VAGAICDSSEPFLTRAQKFERSCGDETSVFIDHPTHGQVCHYRNNALIGAVAFDDVSRFCDDSYQIVAGEDIELSDCSSTGNVDLCTAQGGGGGEDGNAAAGSSCH
jgi:hypothetical protein